VFDQEFEFVAGEPKTYEKTGIRQSTDTGFLSNWRDIGLFKACRRKGWVFRAARGVAAAKGLACAP
jgi:hypothetical protein